MADRLFLKTGVESDDLDKTTEDLNLDNDPEYQKMVAEYTEKVQSMNLMQ